MHLPELFGKRRKVGVASNSASIWVISKRSAKGINRLKTLARHITKHLLPGIKQLHLECLDAISAPGLANQSPCSGRYFSAMERFTQGKPSSSAHYYRMSQGLAFLKPGEVFFDLPRQLTACAISRFSIHSCYQ
jgi:hypothetical protein